MAHSIIKQENFRKNEEKRKNILQTSILTYFSNSFNANFENKKIPMQGHIPLRILHKGGAGVVKIRNF